MSQSNPPSELPNDPIISTSSNPDERSSPTTRSEPSRRSRSTSAHQMGDSLFSLAAQAETEPIPRDGDIPDPQDMLIPDSPTSSPLPSDSDNHITSIHPRQAEPMEPPQPHSQDVRRMKAAGATKSDLSDSDFEIPETEENESDSDYVAGTTTRRRGKKKASSKTVRGKATSKQQTDTKSDTQNASVMAKDPKATVAKGRPQKPGTASKTASRRTKQVANGASVRNSRTNPSADSVPTSVRTSGRTQGGNKAKKDGQLDSVIPDSQVSPAERRSGLKQLTARVPKTSFYNESKDDPSVQAARKTNAAKSQPNSDKKTGNKQSSGSALPASPIVVDDEDVFYLPDLPKEQEHSPLPEAQISNQASLVGPNSKKKRSPLQSGSKSGNAKKTTTRTYGHKVTNKLGSSDLFRGSEEEGVQHEKLPSPAESKLAKDKRIISSNQGEKPIMKETNDSKQTEEQVKKSFKMKVTLSEALQKPATEVTTPGPDAQPSADVAPASSPKLPLSDFPKFGVQKTSEMKLPRSISISKTPNDEAKHRATQPPPAPTKPRDLGETSGNHVRQSNTTSGSLGKAQVENFSDSHQAAAVQRASDLREGKSKAKSGPAKRVHIPAGPTTWPSAQPAPKNDAPSNSDKFDIYVDPPQDVLVPIEEQQHSPKEARSHSRLEMPPVQINASSRVNELGSPSRLLNTAAGTVATFGRSPLRELQQPINQEEQIKLPARHQASLNRSLPWRSQMTSDSEPQLIRADSPIQTSYAKRPQAGNMETSKTIKNLDKGQSVSNHVYRIVLSPSSSAGHPAERTKDFVPQAPRLDPRSIDFASRVAREQKEMEYGQEAGEESLNGIEDRKPAKRTSWLGPKVSKRRRDDPKPAPPKMEKLSHTLGGQSSWERDRRPSNPVSKPGYETKWQEAVDVASGGVIDTLHFISTNLIEHLRSREQSVFAVVNEYKRNGTKISEKLAKRQTGEWLSVSTAVEQKYLELASLYGVLSKNTQDFRAKCLSKHRNQAYTEWQRQTARIKGAIRTAREEALLG